MTTPYSGSNFWRRCHLLVSPESYWFDNLGIFTEGNLLLHCISNLPLGVTNEGREAIKKIFGAVVGDSNLQDRGVAHYLLPSLFSLVSLLSSFCFCFCVFMKTNKNSCLSMPIDAILTMGVEPPKYGRMTCFTWIIFDQFMLALKIQPTWLGENHWMSM